MSDSATQRQPRDGSTLARVRSVARAVAILRCFTAMTPHLTLGEIAAKANLDAGTARRLLVTLRDEGLVEQGADGRYCMTLLVMRLASAVPEARSLRDAAQEDLRALAGETGLTVLLSVLRDGDAVCIAREHGDSPVQVRWWPVGEAMPLNCGAAPRLLLAHMPDSDREAVLGGPLTALTPRSVTDPAVLRATLDRARAQGWSLSSGDVVDGLAALAGAIRNRSGEVVAAVSVGGLESVIIDADGAPRAQVLAAVTRVCARISEKLVD